MCVDCIVVMRNRTHSFTFVQLFTVLQKQVFSFLDSASLCRVAQTCRTFDSAEFRAQSQWERLYAKNQDLGAFLLHRIAFACVTTHVVLSCLFVLCVCALRVILYLCIWLTVAFQWRS